MRNSFFISTAIDYPSEKPHLGHCLEKTQADVIARYKRFRGFNVHFSIGLDEHGLKIQRYAQKVGKKPQEFVDEMSKYFKDLWKILNISNDDFVRTTEKRHEKVVQEIVKKIYEKGDIYKGKYKGLYCVDCESYYLPKDLEGGKCPVHHKPAEVIEEETYFFRMSKYQKELLNHIEKNKDFIIPESKRNEILNRLKEPIQDLSISRATVEWGISFPFNKNLSLFVWIDALINYLTTIDYPSDKFKKFWPADVHLIGKDIVWHHSVIWSSLLLSLGLPLPKTIFAHGFVTVAGQKMSKSLGNIIDPFELVEKYGPDSVRYFILAEFPASEDGDFTYKKFKARYNSDLANGIGNLFERVFTMAKSYGYQSYETKSHKIGCDKEILIFQEKIEAAYSEKMNNYQLYETLSYVFSFAKKLDQYINQKEPWRLIQNKNSEAEKILTTLIFGVKNIISWLKPFMPSKMEEVEKYLKNLGSQKEKLNLFPRI